MFNNKNRNPFENPWDDNYGHDCGGHCPECGEPWQTAPSQRCICREPMMICIPPGQHIHIHCPVHGDVKIYGPRIRMERPMIWKWSKGTNSRAYQGNGQERLGNDQCFFVRSRLARLRDRLETLQHVSRVR